MLRRGLATLTAALALAAAAAASAAPASAGSRLFVGFADHWLLQQPLAATVAATDLGAAGFRIPLYWKPGQTRLSRTDMLAFDNAIAEAFGMRVVVTVVGSYARYAPQTASARNTFCTYIRNFLDRYPTVNDIIIWNEPNKTAVWLPQFFRDGSSAAPAAYQALLARCYDVLHAFRDEVNILAPATSPNGNDNPRAPSNISHSPGNFILKLGQAYRVSGRDRPIFDKVAHHQYGAYPAERPWRPHPKSKMIAQGDWSKLVATLQSAFRGTAQPVPGRCVDGRCATIWYMEAGFQTTIDQSKRRLYTKKENVPRVVPDKTGGEPGGFRPPADSLAPDQATQIVDSVRLAYCQPYVEGFFNYLLRDDRDMRMWQSAPLWRDGRPKDSYPAFRRAIAEAHDDEVDCSALKGGPLPQPDPEP